MISQHETYFFGFHIKAHRNVANQKESQTLACDVRVRLEKYFFLHNKGGPDSVVKGSNLSK